MSTLVATRCRHSAVGGCRHLTLTTVVLVTVALSACDASSTPEAGVPPSGRPGVVLYEESVPSLNDRDRSFKSSAAPRSAGSPKRSGTHSSSTSGEPEDSRRGGANASPRTRSFHSIGSATDKRGDQGVEGPGYADIVAVSIKDNGASARVFVHTATDLPRQPQSGELIGVGVDLWRNPSHRESDYQLFAEADEDGWFAHLQTPRGLVRYPGEFRLSRRRLVFEVRWRHLGDLRSGGFRAFADWSMRRVALNAASGDSTPDTAVARFQR